MKAECHHLKMKRYSSDMKKKRLMVTWDELNSEKISSLDNDQANIYLMVYTTEKDMEIFF